MFITGLKDYLKAAFLIRKSWKQYKRNYEKILKIGGAFIHVDSEQHTCNVHENSCEVVMHAEEKMVNPKDLKCYCKCTKQSCVNGLQEVQAAIAFGYGLFNLVVSLTPPKVLQLAQLFGFHGNQELGLNCLKYVCNSQDVRAELSRYYS